MRAIRPEICLSDLVRVIKALEPDEEALRLTISMLGFKLARYTPKSISKPDIKVNNFLKPPEDNRPESQRRKVTGNVVADLSMKLIEEKRATIPIPSIPEPLQYQSEEKEPLPDYLPLFDPRWTRAIIAKMLSVEANDGILDMQKIIEAFCQNRPIKEIPHRPSPTLRNGIQLLIDCSPGLTPYARDQSYLQDQLKDIIGIDLVDDWAFRGTPLKYAISYKIPYLSNYRLPPQGTPILMLTDVGIATPPFEMEVASLDEWMAFAWYVHYSGCPLLALIPYHQDRWPNILKHQMRMIQWDRGTSVINIMQSLAESM